MARATRDAEETVRAYVDVWNERDYSKIPEVVSESVSVYNPTAPGGEVHGRDGLEAFMRGVVAGFPDFHVAVHDVVSNDDLVMYDATLSMTHEGEFDGIPLTGERSKFRRWLNTTSWTARYENIGSASTSRRSSNSSDSPKSKKRFADNYTLCIRHPGPTNRVRAFGGRSSTRPFGARRPHRRGQPPVARERDRVRRTRLPRADTVSPMRRARPSRPRARRGSLW